jgi:anti-anti-sigma factor
LSDEGVTGEPFGSRVDDRGDEVVVAMWGDLDLASERTALAALDSAHALGEERVVLDLRALRFLGSTGLRILHDTQRRSEREGRELVLVLGDSSERFIALSGMMDLFVVRRE